MVLGGDTVFRRSVQIQGQLIFTDSQLFTDFGRGKLPAFDQFVYGCFLIFNLSATSWAV